MKDSGLGDQGRRVLAASVFLAFGALGLAGPGIAVETTLLDKPFALALPAALLLIGGFLIPPRPRFVAATAVAALILGAGLQTLSWFQTTVGWVTPFPDAIEAGIVPGALCALLVCVGVLAHLLFVAAGQRRAAGT